MSLIYNVGDRVLVAGVNSRNQTNASVPLFVDQTRASAVRLHEAVVISVSQPEQPRADEPATGGVMYLTYIDSEGAVRQLDYGLWQLSEAAFITRVNRNLNRLNLTPAQRRFIAHYVVPRPIVTPQYMRLLRDLSNAVRPAGSEAPQIVYADKEEAFAQARTLSIPAYSAPVSRGITCIVPEEPDLELVLGTQQSEELAYQNPFDISVDTGVRLDRLSTSDDLESPAVRVWNPTNYGSATSPPVDRAVTATQVVEETDSDDDFVSWDDTEDDDE